MDGGGVLLELVGGLVHYLADAGEGLSLVKPAESHLVFKLSQFLLMVLHSLIFLSLLSRIRMIRKRIQSFVVARVCNLQTSLLLVQVVVLDVAAIRGLILLYALFVLELLFLELLGLFSGFATARRCCHLTFKLDDHVVEVGDFAARDWGVSPVTRRGHISLLRWLTAFLDRLALRRLDIVERRLARFLKQLAQNRHCFLLVHVRHHF